MLKLVSSIFFLFCSLVFADNGYIIKEYNSDIKINEKNIYTVEENIKVNFREPRRGIYRVIPEYFNGREIKVSNIDTSEMAHIKDEGKYIYIRLGDPTTYLKGVKNYKISFNQNLGWDRNKEYDEVYFNIIGSDWDTFIERVNFSITLPKPFNPDKINFTSGARGTKSDVAGIKYYIKGNTIIGHSTKVLAPSHSITLALPLEEGYFDVSPSIFDYISGISKFLPFLLYGTILLIVFIIHKKNKDDSEVIESVEFYPPDDLTPTELGYYIDGKVDAKDLTSMIFYWGNKGFLKIDEIESEGFFKRKTTTLTKLKDIETTKEFERFLFDSLFSFGENGVVNIGSLYNKFYKYMEKTVDIFDIGLIKNGKSLYSRDSKKLSKRMSLFIPVTMFSTFGIIALVGNDNIFFALPMFVVAVITCTIIEKLAKNTRKRTAYGNEILGKCLGFKGFLTVTEKDKLEMLLKENPSYFYDILPYTIVLGVSDIWADKFKELVTAPPTWYHSNSLGNAFVYSSFMSNMNRSMSSLNRSMLSSPKSASNFGGGSSSSSGGSSGGGASGGGGGSW